MTYSWLKSLVALVFFLTYTIFQPPATILTRKLGPRLFLSSICLAWGVVMVSILLVPTTSLAHMT